MRELLFLHNYKYQSALYPGLKNTLYDQDARDETKRVRISRQLSVVSQFLQILMSKLQFDFTNYRKYF